MHPGRPTGDDRSATVRLGKPQGQRLVPARSLALIGRLGAESSTADLATQTVNATENPDAGCKDEACVVR